VKIIRFDGGIPGSTQIPKRWKTYFVLDDTANQIKIGRTTIPIDQRLRTLQTGSTAKLRILLVIDGDHESYLHKRFSHLRVQGEWFTASQELLDFIDRAALKETA
jgi:hypothetical protein